MVLWAGAFGLTCSAGQVCMEGTPLADFADPKKKKISITRARGTGFRQVVHTTSPVIWRTETGGSASPRPDSHTTTLRHLAHPVRRRWLGL